MTKGIPGRHPGETAAAVGKGQSDHTKLKCLAQVAAATGHGPRCVNMKGWVRFLNCLRSRSLLGSHLKGFIS